MVDSDDRRLALIEDEERALITLLKRTIDYDPFPLAPRLDPLKIRDSYLGAIALRHPRPGSSWWRQSRHHTMSLSRVAERHRRPAVPFHRRRFPPWLGASPRPSGGGSGGAGFGGSSFARIVLACSACMLAVR